MAIPPVFTSPSIATSIGEWSRLRSWRSSISVVKIVAGHDSLETIVMGQQEGSSNLVLPVIVVRTTGSEHTTCSTVSSLVVMVVNKHHSMHTISHAPVSIKDTTKTVKVSTPDTLGQLDTISELGHLANTKVFLDSDGFSSHVNDLMEEQRFASLGQIIDSSLDGLKITWPHVLTGINSESLDSNVDEIIEVVSNLSSDIVLATIQIIETDQVAVPHLIRISIVLDLTVGLVEVKAAEWNSRIIL